MPQANYVSHNAMPHNTVAHTPAPAMAAHVAPPPHAGSERAEPHSTPRAPAHEGHAEDGAWNFHVQLATGPVEQRYGVANWRNCWNCQVLFYDGTDRKGVCPANGRGHDGHAHESPYNFVVMHGDLPLIE